MPYLQFLGAAGTVTGSKHLIDTTGASSGNRGFKVLIDCGLFQGPKEWRERNWQDTPVPAREIDAVVLTHAHLDHCGWIPRLVKEGFHGPIYATQPTIDLCSVVLPDSGHLQEEDAAFYNKRKASKHDPALPLYTLEEAQDCLQAFQAGRGRTNDATEPRSGLPLRACRAHSGLVHGGSHARNQRAQPPPAFHRRPGPRPRQRDRARQGGPLRTARKRDRRRPDHGVHLRQPPASQQPTFGPNSPP